MMKIFLIIISLLICAPVVFSQQPQVKVEADYSYFDSTKSVVYFKPILTILGPQEKYYLHFYLIGQDVREEKFVLLQLPVKQQKYNWQMKIKDECAGNLCFGWNIVDRNKKNISDPLGAVRIEKKRGGEQ